MSQMIDLYMKVEALEILVNTLKQKTGNEAKGVNITISVNDEMNDYKQNVNAFVAQSKEQRAAGKTKFYVGNGATFWASGSEFVPRLAAAAPAAVPPTPTATAAGLPDPNDDLPF